MARPQDIQVAVSVDTDSSVAADLLEENGFERQAVLVRSADRIERMLEGLIEYVGTIDAVSTAGKTLRACRVCGSLVLHGPTLCNECGEATSKGVKE